MKIWEDIEKFRATNPVVTIGIFDGVHCGHHFLIDRLKDTAVKMNGSSVVVTLWPHPRVVLQKDADSLRYLLSLEEKKVKLAETGIDHLVIIPFTREFSMLESCEFVEEYLVKKLRLKHLLVGFNHKFGKGREGDYSSLYSCANRFGFGISRLERYELAGEGISSSLIRELLLSGQLSEANNYLGYHYFLQGKVGEGNKLGRKMGFPTANIVPHDPHKLIPCDGVYAVEVETSEGILKGMLNIGYRPTLSTGVVDKTIEVNLFDFDSDLYRQDVTIRFHFRMRDEKKFEGIEQLKAQLVNDKEKAIELLGKLS